MNAILHFDGSCQPNPGETGIGFTIRGTDGTLLAQRSASAGEGTNNVAEYTALLHGLREALKLGVKVIHVRGDSQIVVKAVRGEWRCHEPRLKRLLADIQALRQQFAGFSIEHIRRELNAHADRLSTGANGSATAATAPKSIALPKPTAGVAAQITDGIGLAHPRACRTVKDRPRRRDPRDTKGDRRRVGSEGAKAVGTPAALPDHRVAVARSLGGARGLCQGGEDGDAAGLF